MSVAPITAEELYARLLGEGELALLDVREQGAFGAQGHILYASCAPLSRLELRAPRLAPRRSVPVVVCDGGEEVSEDGGEGGGARADGARADGAGAGGAGGGRPRGLARRAAARLAALGYTDVRVLAGGTAGWRAAGYTLFTGINVPSKAFGEYVEHEFGTPSIDAQELQAMRDAGEPVVVLDSRPMDEFRATSIPGGVCCPGAELVYRVGDAAPDPAATVVVNCAGRTRSIIGAQSLINAGVANRVLALRNGTMGWHLAGLELAHGCGDEPPPRGAAWREGAARAAERVARRFGVEYADAPTLDTWRAEADTRTLFVFDVRSPEEYRAGHPADAVHAPGGQLVQTTDDYVGVQGARIALVDDDGVRATLTASWLRQMGWDAWVVRGALEAGELATGSGGGPVAPAAAGPGGAGGAGGVDGPGGAARRVAPAELRALLDEGDALVLDLADSRTFRRAHVPGAYHALRADLEERLAGLPVRSVTVLTSPDGAFAALGCADLAAAADGAGAGVGAQRDVRVLDGGTRAWTEAGFGVESGAERIASGVNDVWLRPYDRGEGVEAAMREYLAWEVGLVEQLARDGTARFGPFRAGGQAGGSGPVRE